MSGLQLIGHRQIILDGELVRYSLKRSLRARRLRLEIRLESGLTVVIPRNFAFDRIEPFLYRKKQWITRKLADCRTFQSMPQVSEADYVFYLGEKLRIIEQHNHSNTAYVHLERDSIIIHPGINGDVEDLLRSWFIGRAKEFINMKAKHLSLDIGVRYGRITIRDARTRWGSCSKLGNLNFNWKLIRAPEPVIDYVIIHELCHLIYMNHSSKFWKLVGKYCPEYYRHRKWLKEYETVI